jgi:arsenate reductase-like glutaredoxin family protein
VTYAFHDYKKAGADPAQIARWVAEAGLDKVLNKAGTTFKKLDAADKADMDDEKGVMIMAQNPSASAAPSWKRTASWWRWASRRRIGKGCFKRASGV